MDFQVVKENALKYLGYQAPMFEGLTPGISSLLGECIEEIKQITDMGSYIHTSLLYGSEISHS